MLPTFVILGAQKSATSLLQNCLREHPDVFMRGDETPYFEDPTFGRQSPEEFEAQFAEAEGAAAIGIKRPEYLCRPECPKRIHDGLPNAKLIAVLRSPVERAVSAYFWYMRQKHIPLQPLNQGMEALLDGSLLSGHPRAAEILSFGLYHAGLSRYLALFPREQMKLLLHEDVLSDALGVLTGMCEFLGISPDFNPPSLSSRPKQTIYNLRRLKVLTRPALHPHVIRFVEPDFHVFSGTAWRNNFRYLAKIAVVGTDRLILARVFPSEKPRLDPGLRERLEDYYREDIARLAVLLGRDLSRWLISEKKRVASNAN